MFFQDLFQLSIGSHDSKKTTNLMNQAQRIPWPIDFHKVKII